ncbi:pyridoxamine 5'-phosphate oxidase [Phenylobacterium sp.]|uniref:pyridoxamine 5'-phosphate oxidase n=1 Tax=Phenylobacterium sp. TaxID=1871053 RepID=UPI0019ACF7F7|nr:pyridoxamine 5'-phosphate oxidase [Phenylobacterium sp.]MBC7167391.1 pyridoxamine 5'-phosphate oxidase [Phenylobacterium sp.]
MSETPDKSLIPASPSEDEYVRQVTQAEPPPLLSEDDPFALFADWLKEAGEKEPNDPNAMAVATADEHGLPDVRMVLLKDVDPEGFVFYTNLGSAKGRQLAANPQAALLFHWKSLRRQVRVRGTVSPVSDAEADAYFATRARPAQLGAWASEQSRPLPDRLALEKRIAEAGLKFGLGKVARPPHWSGFRIRPQTIEFWRDRPFRLHERLVFQRAEGGWTTERLYP